MTDRTQDALEQISLVDFDPMDLVAPNFRVTDDPLRVKCGKIGAEFLYGGPISLAVTGSEVQS